MLTFDRAAIEVGHGAVGLGIEVDQEGLQTLGGEGGGEVDGGGGLPDSPFLIRDADDHGNRV